jgi:PAS domain S-box-containing protein
MSPTSGSALNGQQEAGPAVLDLLILLSTMALGQLSFSVDIHPDGLPGMWLPAGFLVGVMSRWGIRPALSGYFGLVIASLMAISDWYLSLSFAFGSLLALVATCLIIRQFGHGLQGINWHSGIVLLGASGAGAAVQASVPLAITWLSGRLVPGEAWATVNLLFASHFFGVVAFAPVMLTANRRHLIAVAAHPLQVILWLCGLSAYALALFQQSDPDSAHLLISAQLVLAGWPALTMGRFGAASAICIVSTLSLAAAAHGFGPFVENVGTLDAPDDTLVFIGCVISIGWLICGIAERQQRTNRDMLMREDALTQIAEAVLVSDPRGKIVYGNAGFERITGYALSEVIDRTCSFLKGVGSDPAVIDEIRFSLRNAKPFVGEILNYRKDGKPFWNELSITPAFDEAGHVKRFVGVLRDISARVATARELADALTAARQALEQSRHAEARYASILDSAMVGIISIDRAGRIVTYNREAEVIFGYSPVEMIGQSLDRLLPPSFARQHHAYVDRFATGSSRQQRMSDWRSVKALRKDGSEFQMMAVLSKVEIAGQLIMTAIFRDMTEIVDRERDLQRLAAENAMEAEKAKAADVAKSHFLANMSHELRTPLNAIIGFSELMAREQLGPIENDAYVEFAKDIHNSGQILLRVINEVLEFTRIEANKYDMRIREVDPVDAIRKALADMQGKLASGQLSLKLSIDNPVCRVLVDEGALRQILDHILANAIKFTGKGGQISLSVEAHNAIGMVAIVVRDTGRGIPADRLDTIGQPFEQVASAYSRDVGGTGLGLAICISLARTMSGDIRIDSEFGKGTAVHLTLPDAAASRPGRPALPKSVAKSGN